MVMRGVIQRILGGNDARPGQVAHALDGVFRITRQPLDGRFADLVLRTFRHLEHDADLAIVVRDLVRSRDLRVQIAVVPVDCGQLVATLRQLVGGDGTVGEPAKRIPPREVVNRRVQFRYVNHFRLQHVTRLLVSWRKTKRYLVFNDQMLLVGWVNIVTGEVKSPFPEVRAQLQQLPYPLAIGDEPLVVAGHLHLFAFSGIHAFSPTLFPQMVGWPNKFPIMDFYLKACATTPIMGYVKPDLRLMDVGKIDTLSDADDFVSTLVP